LSPGTRIGPYEIVAAIGAGGMGEVYRATDTRLKRAVAVKALHESFALDAERVARFEREAQLLASLNHPNIAAIYGVEEVQGTTFLVLELVDGPTLADLLKASAMPRHEAVSCARQIADALGAAHERGIIHRDFKPGNVMVTPEGQVKVLDFGLGKALEGEGSFASNSGAPFANSPTLTRAPTQLGMILGTGGYMSPEQAKGRPTDRRTDIWAFGCVLFEMLTGSRAFEGEDVTETLAAIVRGEPDWTRLPADLPPSLRMLLERCLLKDRALRLADMSVVRFLLSDTGVSLSTATAAVGTNAGVGDPGDPRPTWRRMAPAILSTALATALLAFGLTRWFGSPGGAMGPSGAVRARSAHVSIALPEGYELGSTHLRPIAISRDGTRIAYVGQRDEKNRIFVRTLDDPEARALDGTDGGDGPFFSPDGQWIAFFAGSKLKKIAVGGAAQQTLAEAPSQRGGAWGDDGYLYFAPTNMSGIWRVPEGGGAATEVTRPDAAGGEVSHRWPQRIAGTPQLLFSVWTGPGDDEHHVAVQTLSAGPHRRLVTGGDAPQYAANPGLLLYTHRGQLFTVPWRPGAQDLGKAVPVAAAEWPSDGIGNEGCGNYTVSDDGTLLYLRGGRSSAAQRLVWIDRAGALTPLPLPARIYENVAISPDGSRAVIQIREGIVRLWIFDFASGTLTPIGPGAASSQAAQWTADGRRVIYRGTRGGTRNLYWIPVDGSSGEERLTAKPGVIQTPTSASSDGRFLLFAEHGPEEPEGVGAWVLPLTGDRTPRRLFPLPATGHDGQFSPDGRWIAYHAMVSSRMEIFVAPSTGSGERRLVSTAGGTEPLWSPDGRELFFQSGSRLMGVTLTPGVTPRMPPGGTFSASSPRLVHEGRFLQTVTGNTSFALTPDGTRFLRIQPVDPEPAITRIELVLDWFAELRRQTTKRAE
ncbi:MAG: protein kinase, partial [Thermoanaerobaculia bacterium]